MFLNQERQKTPVVTRNTGLSVPGKPETGFRHIPRISFEDVRVRYSSSDSAMTGANIFKAPEGLPVQMCPVPGDEDPQHDAEAELSDFHSEDDLEDHFNVSTTSGPGRKEVCHISTGHIVAEERDQGTLTADAKEIQGSPEKKAFSGSTTVVCAALQTKKGYLHIAMVNRSRIPPKMKAEAERRGYVAVRGANTHAEANLLLYADKHKTNARLRAFGCDKDTCPQCAKLLRKYGPRGLAFPVRGRRKDGTKQYCPVYHFKGVRRYRGGDGEYVRGMREMICKRYKSKNGKLRKGAAAGARRANSRRTGRAGGL